MRTITGDLRLRLEAVKEERRRIAWRLDTLDDLAIAINLLIREENALTHGGQLSMLPTANGNGSRRVGNTELSRFIFEALSDAHPHTLEDLVVSANHQGLDFNNKSPGRTLHFALIGLQKNGYTRMVAPRVWSLTSKGLPPGTSPAFIEDGIA